MLQREGIGGPNRPAERGIAGRNDRLVEQQEISKDNRRANRIDRDTSGIQHCEPVTRPKDQFSFRSYSTSLGQGWICEITGQPVRLRIVVHSPGLRIVLRKALMRREPEMSPSVFTNILDEVIRETVLRGDPLE